MSRPRVSVAIATYNGEAFLRPQLESIYAQTWRGLDVVVSDDASTDGTGEILREFERSHGLRVHYGAERQGIVQNFSRAIRLCAGDLIALSDQDDLWKPHKIERLVAGIGGATLIYGNISEYVGSDGVVREDEQIRPFVEFARRHGSGHPTRYLLAENWVVSHSVMLRRELVEHALPIPPAQPFHDGWLALVASKLGGLVFLDECLQIYRRHAGSLTWADAATRRSARRLREVFGGEFARDWRRRCEAETARLEECGSIELLSDDDRLFLDQLLTYYRTGLEPGFRRRAMIAGWRTAPYFSSPSLRDPLTASLRAGLAGLRAHDAPLTARKGRDLSLADRAPAARTALRVLIVSHPRLDPRLGAAQTALELSAALRDRGHDVTTWSPSPLPGRPRGRQAMLAQNDALERYLRRSAPFDVLDVPSVSLTAKVAASGFTVSRSVQPEIEYLLAEIRRALRTRSPWLLAHLLRIAYLRPALLGGWRRADRILCLGSIEREAMERRFPALRPKIAQYLCAPPAADRARLLAIRGARPGPGLAPTDALWIGRWAAQKGTDTLIALIERLAARSQLRFTIAGAGDAPRTAVPEGLLAAGRVRVVPTFERGELPGLLAAHQIGLFTSSVEGWGVSVNEMLESGLTVYARHAGSVADLAAFFPDTLRPLAAIDRLEVAGPEDLEATGYLATVSWPAIAARYEEDVLTPATRRAQSAAA